MYSEDELLPLSGLQHLVFCERQWALIHIERQWEENRLTAEGRLLHEAAHEDGTEVRPGLLTARGLPLRSFRLGVSGQADVVEYQSVSNPRDGAVQLCGRTGWWRPVPVEYK
jgi:CRISPR-associated exonuclease Cas4